MSYRHFQFQQLQKDKERHKFIQETSIFQQQKELIIDARCPMIMGQAILIIPFLQKLSQLISFECFESLIFLKNSFHVFFAKILKLLRFDQLFQALLGKDIGIVFAYILTCFILLFSMGNFLYQNLYLSKTNNQSKEKVAGYWKTARKAIQFLHIFLPLFILPFTDLLLQPYRNKNTELQQTNLIINSIPAIVVSSLMLAILVFEIIMHTFFFNEFGFNKENVLNHVIYNFEFLFPIHQVLTPIPIYLISDPVTKLIAHHVVQIVMVSALFWIYLTRFLYSNFQINNLFGTIMFLKIWIIALSFVGFQSEQLANFIPFIVLFTIRLAKNLSYLSSKRDFENILTILQIVGKNITTARDEMKEKLDTLQKAFFSMQSIIQYREMTLEDSEDILEVFSEGIPIEMIGNLRIHSLACTNSVCQFRISNAEDSSFSKFKDTDDLRRSLALLINIMAIEIFEVHNIISDIGICNISIQLQEKLPIFKSIQFIQKAMNNREMSFQQRYQISQMKDKLELRLRKAEEESQKIEQQASSLTFFQINVYNSYVSAIDLFENQQEKQKKLLSSFLEELINPYPKLLEIERLGNEMNEIHRKIAQTYKESPKSLKICADQLKQLGKFWEDSRKEIQKIDKDVKLHFFYETKALKKKGDSNTFSYFSGFLKVNANKNNFSEIIDDDKNTQHLFGFPDLKGRQVSNLVPEFFMKDHLQLMENYIETEKSHIVQRENRLIGRKSNGNIFYFLATIKPYQENTTNSFIFLMHLRLTVTDLRSGIILCNEYGLCTHQGGCIRKLLLNISKKLKKNMFPIQLFIPSLFTFFKKNPQKTNRKTRTGESISATLSGDETAHEVNETELKNLKKLENGNYIVILKISTILDTEINIDLPAIEKELSSMERSHSHSSNQLMENIQNVRTRKVNTKKLESQFQRLAEIIPMFKEAEENWELEVQFNDHIQEKIGFIEISVKNMILLKKKKTGEAKLEKGTVNKENQKFIYFNTLFNSKLVENYEKSSSQSTAGNKIKHIETEWFQENQNIMVKKHLNQKNVQLKAKRKYNSCKLKQQRKEKGSSLIQSSIGPYIKEIQTEQISESQKAKYQITVQKVDLKPKEEESKQNASKDSFEGGQKLSSQNIKGSSQENLKKASELSSDKQSKDPSSKWLEEEEFIHLNPSNQELSRSFTNEDEFQLKLDEIRSSTSKHSSTSSAKSQTKSVLKKFAFVMPFPYYWLICSYLFVALTGLTSFVLTGTQTLSSIKSFVKKQSQATKWLDYYVGLETILQNAHNYKYSKNESFLTFMEEESVPMLNSYETFINPPLPGLATATIQLSVQGKDFIDKFIKALYSQTAISHRARKAQMELDFIQKNGLLIYETFRNLANMENQLKEETSNERSAILIWGFSLIGGMIIFIISMLWNLERCYSLLDSKIKLLLSIHPTEYEDLYKQFFLKASKTTALANTISNINFSNELSKTRSIRDQNKITKITTPWLFYLFSILLLLAISGMNLVILNQSGLLDNKLINEVNVQLTPIITRGKMNYLLMMLGNEYIYNNKNPLTEKLLQAQREWISQKALLNNFILELESTRVDEFKSLVFKNLCLKEDIEYDFLVDLCIGYGGGILKAGLQNGQEFFSQNVQEIILKHNDLFEAKIEHVGIQQDDMLFLCKIINYRTRQIMKKLNLYWESQLLGFEKEDNAILSVFFVFFFVIFCAVYQFFCRKNLAKRLENCELLFLLIPVPYLYRSIKIKRYLEAKLSSLESN